MAEVEQDVASAPGPAVAASPTSATSEPPKDEHSEDAYSEDERSEDALEADDEEWDWSERPIPRWWGWLAFVLSAAGFGDALYLTIDHFRGVLPSCPATGVINCTKVTTSEQSHILGIPVALLGLLFFTAVLVVNVPAFWRAGGVWRTRLAYVRLALMLSGMGFVCWLIYAEAFLIKAICLWCTGVHIATFCLFVLVVATFSRLAGGQPLTEEE